MCVLFLLCVTGSLLHDFLRGMREVRSVRGHTFFFYGSLMDRELLEAVIDRSSDHLDLQRARLCDHVVETALGYSFPTLVAKRGAKVDGVLAKGLSDADVARISYFEDTEYETVNLTVSTVQAHVMAQVFVANATLASSGDAWDFSHWRAHHKQVLVAVTRKVMREHYGVTPFEDIDRHWHRIKAEIEAEMALGRLAETQFPNE